MSNFEYTADVPTEDGEGTEKVTLTFKPIAKLPVGVLRRNRGDQEGLMWDTFEWGLSADDLAILDRLPGDELEDVMQAWGDSAPVDQDKPTGKPALKSVEG